MMEIIMMMGYLILVCFIIHTCFKDMYNTAIPNINFYLASSIDNDISNHSLYNITVYKKPDDIIKDDSFMIFLQPQNFYFFLEDKEFLIYHPDSDKREKKKFKCKDYINYEIAYSFSINDNDAKVICHRKLEYLKNLYTQRVFYKTFDSLQSPVKIIKMFIEKYYFTGKEIRVI